MLMAAMLQVLSEPDASSSKRSSLRSGAGVPGDRADTSPAPHQVSSTIMVKRRTLFLMQHVIVCEANLYILMLYVSSFVTLVQNLTN